MSEDQPLQIASPSRPRHPVSAVLIHVADWRQGLAWYHRAFPAGKVVQVSGGEWAYLDIDGVQIEVVPADEKVGSGSAGTVVYWFAEDFDSRMQYLQSIGATLYRGPLDIAQGVAMCQLKDPFGNLIGIRGLRPSLPARTQALQLNARGSKVNIRRPSADDGDEFLALARSSADFLRPWIDPPVTVEKFTAYIKKLETTTDRSFFVCDSSTHRIAGVINISCIVAGFLQSAYLGYWVGAAYARQGYMSEAMRLVIQYAFNEMKLHRLEANIQPGNTASIALAQSCGFEKEGYSPKYLNVLGEWRDHERWAIRSDADQDP